ncbi:Na+/H+ antiporter subunit E [Amycolatopsis australiensis]|uniref:Na+/H+ ion antiporter subunit n=1 Tax=Amycolatopsis australiensis TaxID=546364 RepID=A0A1K1SAJ2_9PSEU|nr:Na+/H+ antiporter subunit E [Amycolatopsis australiensis]SFW81242.1 Na+/H+ ion antiporter subunit [Amycolatopsis australiensis]
MRVTSEVLPWWAGLTGLWVLTLSTPSLPEIVAAGVAAVPCAFAARAARRAVGGAWRPRARWARWPLAVPGTAVRESVRAVAEVVRHPRAGRFDTASLPDEPGAVQDARAACAAVVVGSTPGTMVVATPPGDRELVVHRLLDGGSRVLDEVRR